MPESSSAQNPRSAPHGGSDESIPELSILIPVLNEAQAIPDLAQEISHAMGDAGVAWEVLWIENGSTDNTLAVLRGLQRPHRYIRFSENCGQSAAYRAGAEAARGRWLATLDGDGQNDPADLPNLLRAADRAGVDCVFGIRTMRKDPWIRAVSARLANWFRNWITGVQISDCGCATRVMRRDLFLRMPFFQGSYYFYPFLADMLGGTFVEAPVNHRARRFGTTNYGIHNRLIPGLVDVFGVCWLRNRNRVWTIVEHDGILAVPDVISRPPDNERDAAVSCTIQTPVTPPTQ